MVAAGGAAGLRLIGPWASGAAPLRLRTSETARLLAGIEAPQTSAPAPPLMGRRLVLAHQVMASMPSPISLSALILEVGIAIGIDEGSAILADPLLQLSPMRAAIRQASRKQGLASSKKHQNQKGSRKPRGLQEQGLPAHPFFFLGNAGAPTEKR